jgi:hypothetical protein
MWHEIKMGHKAFAVAFVSSRMAGEDDRTRSNARHKEIAFPTADTKENAEKNKKRISDFS